ALLGDALTKVGMNPIKHNFARSACGACCVVASLFVFICVATAPAGEPSLATNVLAEQKPTPMPGEKGSDLLWKKLETRVSKIADQSDGVMGIAILDLTDGGTLLHNGVRVFPSASSIQISIMVELYHHD